MQHPSYYQTIQVSGKDAAKFLQGQITFDIEKVTNQQEQLAACCNIQGRVIALFFIIKNEESYLMTLPEDTIEPLITHLKKYAVFSKVEFQALDKTTTQIDDNAAQLEMIDKNIAEIIAVNSEKFTPHDLNLVEAGAISFDKGCYQGQEIVARMHYRGNPKQRLYKVEFDAERKPTVGDKLMAEQTTAGTVLQVAKTDTGSFVALASIKDKFADLFK
jgi:folate-binding protein YgfZ